MTDDASSRGPRPHRPARFADLTEMIDMMDAAGGDPSAGTRAEVAAATAAAVVQAGRSPLDPHRASSDDLFVELADTVGLDTLAALWRDSDPVSLPGALWTLYVLRQWCHTATDDVVRLWRTGEPLAPADAVVAGLPDFAADDAVRDYADAVLAGVFRRDLAVALERAAAFFRVVAAGRRAGDDSSADAAHAERNERAAASLTAAARQWRAGTLS